MLAIAPLDPRLYPLSRVPAPTRAEDSEQLDGLHQQASVEPATVSAPYSRALRAIRQDDTTRRYDVPFHGPRSHKLEYHRSHDSAALLSRYPARDRFHEGVLPGAVPPRDCDPPNRSPCRQS